MRSWSRWLQGGAGNGVQLVFAAAGRAGGSWRSAGGVPGESELRVQSGRWPAHAIEPLRFDDDADAAWDRLRRTVRAQPRMRVITEDDGYLHAEATTRLLRFVDDVEFLLDRVGRQIHVRSASRLGYSDLGTNRRRIEAIPRRVRRHEMNDAARRQHRHAAPGWFGE
ncbi:MAG: DUF1499 domain-containing protein [Gemmataceae bacterium]